MVWTYKKRIKVIPGVYLNVSKNGISTTIGVRGASVPLGQTGTYLNTSIPGTGIAQRTKIADGSRANHSPPVQPPVSQEDAEHGIFSADIGTVTSHDMEGIRQAIIGAYRQFEELKTDLADVRRSIAYSRFELILSFVLLYGFFLRSHVREIREGMAKKMEIIPEIEAQMARCKVKIDITLSPEIQLRYDALVTSFGWLSRSRRIWDVTSSKNEDRRATRSAASASVSRQPVIFEEKGIDRIETSASALRLQNTNGADIYIYPTFIAMHSAGSEIAVIGYSELDVFSSTTEFIENAGVPSDSKIVGQAWYKSNMDGSRDKRFKDNYQIPIAEYGVIALKTAKGVNEEYNFSNVESCTNFAKAFAAYRLAVKDLKYTSGESIS